MAMHLPDAARPRHTVTIPPSTVGRLPYDLVYVVVIARAAHHLAEHVSVRGVPELAVVFALIWIAWINGTLYLELHGRGDGRTRTFVFAQMDVIALLACSPPGCVRSSRAAPPVELVNYQIVHHSELGRRDAPDVGRGCASARRPTAAAARTRAATRAAPSLSAAPACWRRPTCSRRARRSGSWSRSASTSASPPRCTPELGVATTVSAG